MRSSKTWRYLEIRKRRSILWSISERILERIVWLLWIIYLPDTILFSFHIPNFRYHKVWTKRHRDINFDVANVSFVAINSQNKSSYRKWSFIERVFLKISQNSQENTCFGVSFIVNLLANLLKKTIQHRRFPVNFAIILRNVFYRTPPGDCFCRKPCFDCHIKC